MITIDALASSSAGNCYRISDGSTMLLLEAGIKFKDIQILLNFRTSNINGCLISHSHNDHAKAVKDVIKTSIDCYMTKGTADALEVRGHRVKIVKAQNLFQIGTWSVIPFEIQHDAAEPVGYLLENKAGDRLLFATDTYYLKYRFPGLTHIMVECNYALDILQENVEAGLVPPGLKDRILKSHFSLEHVKDFLRVNDLSRVREIWLIHLSDGNSDADRFKREIQSLTGKHVIVASE